VRIFGGHILVLGGTMWLAGCELGVYCMPWIRIAMSIRDCLKQGSPRFEALNVRPADFVLIAYDLAHAAGNFIIFAPYGSPFLNALTVGGHILIVAGNGLAFGTHHVGCAFG
jgi:hypothetical protein